MTQSVIRRATVAPNHFKKGLFSLIYNKGCPADQYKRSGLIDQTEVSGKGLTGLRPSFFGHQSTHFSNELKLRP